MPDTIAVETVTPTAARHAAATGQDPGQEPGTALPVAVPGRVGGETVMGSTPRRLTDAAGATVAEVGVTRRLVQFRMADLAARTSGVLRSIGDDAWYGLLRRAAEDVRTRLAGGAAEPYVRAMSATTGLPLGRVRHGLATVADDLARMDEILAAQVPGGDLAVYRTGRVRGAEGWRWMPAGRSAFVRVAANFPTIVIEWLQTLAARRPVLLETSATDPFTTHLFADALYAAGLPDGALSVCHGPAPALARLADQVIWPGEDVPADIDRGKLHTYHFGRSKAVLADYQPTDAEWSRLARMAHHGCGRLCTNLSGLAVTGEAGAARAAATRLAAELDLAVRPLAEPGAVVPAFPDADRYEDLARLIEREVAAGAVDVSAEVTGRPLRERLDGAAFLRPTVLLVDTDSPLWGVELPFPFVTVTAVPRSRLRAACANSLIIAVPGDREDVVEALAEEPSTDKVFGGADFDRGYHPLDPHEGYLADFLFRKKAVRTNPPQPDPPGAGRSTP